MDMEQLLSKSRAVMQATTKDLPKQKSNTNSANLFEERELPDLTGDYVKKYASQIGSFQSEEDNFTITENHLSKSALPDSIKKAFLNEVVKEEPKVIPQQRTQNIQENIIQTNNFSNLNENQIREIVKDEMTRFLSKYFTKALTEQVKKQLVK